MKLLNLIDKTVSSGTIAYTQNTSAISITGIRAFSAQLAVTVNTPSAKTFDAGSPGVRIIQDLTYTSVAFSVGANSITIAYTAGGTAGAEVVTVVGNAISISIDTGVSTATQIKTAYDLSAAAIALATVAVSGTGSNAQVAAVAVALAGGTASEVNLVANTVTIPTHGFLLGNKGQLTSTGTLPAGLSTSTDYFIIVVDANTVAFATSLVNAAAGTKIDITNPGTALAVNTFTPTSIAGASAKLQKSDDGVTWFDEGSGQNITQSTNLYFEVATQPTAKYYSFLMTLTAGQFIASMQLVGKGEN